MEPSYGLLIRPTTARLIYSPNQALINSRTLVRHSLKVLVIIHSGNMDATNNQNMANAPLSQTVEPITLDLIVLNKVLKRKPRGHKKMLFFLGKVTDLLKNTVGLF